MERLRRAGILTLVCAAPLCGFVYLVVRVCIQRDPYRFLQGQVPYASGVTAPPEHAGGRGRPIEYRVYSWRAPFAKVASAVSKELTSLGFARAWKSSTEVGWNQDAKIDVWIHEGPSKTRMEGLSGKHRLDPRWVTVVVEQVIPEDWIYHARLAIEPNDY